MVPSLNRLVGLTAAGGVLVLGLLVLGGDIGFLQPLARLIPFEGFGGLTPPQLLLAGGFVVVGGYITASSDEELSFPFVLSLVAVLTVAWRYLLPETVARALPLEELGLSLANLDVVGFAVLVAIAIVAYYAVRNRAGDGGNTASSVARRTARDLERLADQWGGVLRYVAVALIGVVAAVVAQTGPVAGELATRVGEAPVVFADAATVALGWLALEGVLDLRPVIWLALAGGLGVIAVGVRYADG